MYKVKLINSQQGWLARFEDPKVIELFGTDTLPTAYTEQASPMMVLEGIQKKNPDYKVMFAV